MKQNNIIEIIESILLTVFFSCMLVGTAGIVTLAFLDSLLNGFIALIVAGFIWLVLITADPK